MVTSLNLVLEGLLRVCIVGHFAETMNVAQIFLQSDVEKMDYSTILAKMANLHHLFHKALDEYRLLQVNPNLSKYLEDAPPESLILPALWPPFTREVLDAFPSATYDIKETGNCLAVTSLGKGQIY
jgi:hypothetical protein